MSTFTSASATVSRSFVSKLRFWSSNAQVASTTDIEAQLPVVPAPAHILTSARLPSASDSGLDPEDDCTDAIDDFFGVTYTREERRARRLAQTQASVPPAHASRHDAPIYIPEFPSEDEKDPPSYAESDKDSDECATIVAELPTYSEAVQVSSFDSESEQPWCIPQGLFRYGFCTSFSFFFDH